MAQKTATAPKKIHTVRSNFYPFPYFLDGTEVRMRTDDVQYEPEWTRLQDPLKMDPNRVNCSYFRDARLYDSDTCFGFQVQHGVAKHNYERFKREVRKRPGWAGYRRPPKVVYEEVEDLDEFDDPISERYVVRKVIFPSVPGLRTPPPIIEVVRHVPHWVNVIRLPPPKKSTTKNPIIHTRVHGKYGNEDDIDHPRMFTLKMGKEVARLRTGLGLTQAQLASKINVDANYIRNVELGDILSFNSEDVVVKKLASALGVPSIKYQ